VTTQFAYEELQNRPVSSPAESPGRRRELAVVAVDRVAVVLVPVAAVLAGSGLSLQTILTIVTAATVWFFTLRSSHKGPRLSTLALGTGVVTAVGTASGLAVVSLIDFWLPGIELSIRQLLLMAGGVFLTSFIFEARRDKPSSRRRLLLVGSDEGMRSWSRSSTGRRGFPLT
jgi:uncharacterized RDD family membrane protein YckC